VLWKVFIFGGIPTDESQTKGRVIKVLKGHVIVD